VLTSFAQLLADRRRGTAVGAFTCYDLEEAAAVLHAAAAAQVGVILLIANQTYAGRGGGLLLSALVAAAARSEAQACVQLDHCGELSAIESALEAGAGAVMADGSKLPYDDKVRFVRAAVDLARAHDAAVEAELGSIDGDEDVARAVAAGALTEPDEAADFVSRTGADCLAVSIGNVHGIYRDPPRFDWVRLDEIRRRVAVPLSLHGASGVPDEMVSRAIETGIAKINVNTELRAAYLEATRGSLPAAIDGAKLAALHETQTAAVEHVVAARLRAFGVRAP